MFCRKTRKGRQETSMKTTLNDFSQLNVSNTALSTASCGQHSCFPKLIKIKTTLDNTRPQETKIDYYCFREIRILDILVLF